MSLSRTASPTIGSEKRPCQSSVDNWLKITVELTCVRSSITSRRSRPSAWSKTLSPQSSRIRSLMFFNSRMRRLYEPSPLAMAITETGAPKLFGKHFQGGRPCTYQPASGGQSRTCRPAAVYGKIKIQSIAA